MTTKLALGVLAALVVVAGGGYGFKSLYPTEYERCDHYTQELNGGVRTFNGQSFTIQLCGTGGDLHYNDQIRMRIFDAKGALQAARVFTINWGDNGMPKKLEYKHDSIIFYDNNGKDFDKVLTMPPTFWDWLGAKIH